jgi:CHASE3 domain sensor protein
MRSFSMPKMAISLLLALLAACILIGINETGYSRSTGALDDIAEASRTRGALNRLLQDVLDGETGSRGYLLTGDPRYLEPYNAAVGEITQRLDNLQLLHTANADEFATLSQLGRNVQRKLAEMELSVRMRKEGNEEAWKFVLMTDVGKEHMDAIREQATKLIEASTARMEVSQVQVRRSLLLSRIGIAAVAMAGLLAFYLYLRQSTVLKLAGEEQQQILQQERDLLERQNWMWPASNRNWAPRRRNSRNGCST